MLSRAQSVVLTMVTCKTKTISKVFCKWSVFYFDHVFTSQIFLETIYGKLQFCKYFDIIERLRMT